MKQVKHDEQVKDRVLEDLKVLGDSHELDAEPYLSKVFNDFQFCLSETWKCINLPTPSWVQRDIADWLIETGDRKVTMGFRGVSKTWVTCAFILWRAIALENGDNMQTTIISKSAPHSKKTLKMILGWTKTVPFFRHLQPNPRYGHRNSEEVLDFGTRTTDMREGSIEAYGIGGQVTGNRADLIVPDDLETKENTRTHDMREWIEEQIKEFENMIQPTGEILWLGTSHHEDSIYDKLERQTAYRIRRWPARAPKPSERVINLAPNIQRRLISGDLKPGDPIWPERFTHQIMLKKEGLLGRTEWLRQWMLVSGLKDKMKYPLKLSDLIVFPCQGQKVPVSIAWGTHDSKGSTVIEDIACLGFDKDKLYRPIFVDEQWQRFQQTAMWVDPAGQGKDKTAYAIGGTLNGMIFIKQVEGLDGGYSIATLRHIATQARIHQVQVIHVEDFALQGAIAIMLETLIETEFRIRPGQSTTYPEGWNCSVIATKLPNIQKELRIIGFLEPPMNSHRIVVDPSVLENEVFQQQLTRITRQKNCLGNEDELESVASLVGQFEEVLMVNPEFEKAKRAHQQQQDQLNAYAANVTTNKRKSVIRIH